MVGHKKLEIKLPYDPAIPLLGIHTEETKIKRHLLLERKVITNPDSIFKSRDITLPTTVRLVKAMVFPVVMYGCESWTIKKAERQKLML